MTHVIGSSQAVLQRRRALLEDFRKAESVLEVAAALDRAAGRIGNPRVADVLHERAEARREAVRRVHGRLSGRLGTVPWPGAAMPAGGG